MPLLLTDDALAARRVLATGPLALLTSSLLAETALVATRGIVLPTWKARFTRGYARCTTCGGPLVFDPWSPHRHLGLRCTHRSVGAEADGWWAVGAQLWAADRAVHAATLATLADDAEAHDVAVSILEAIAVHAPLHDERDSVLGPSGPFFSTYLDAIWVLSIAVAVDLLEADARGRPAAHPAAARAQQVAGLVIDQVLLPTVARIAQFDEGASNRQRWNDAALLAVARLTEQQTRVDALCHPRTGALARALDGLLADGTWSEGENYHQFAVRGLWYLVRMHRTAERPLPDDLARRMALAWSVPLRSRWPDLTLAARRDAQYGVSLQQWRWAEWCELGRVESDAPVLSTVLHTLYHSSHPLGESGRLVATGESETNRPPVALSRADLGWKSLLFAREDAPASSIAPDEPFTLLAEQGLAVLRQRGPRGTRMAALDYGHAGGGHGHPDRLALTLADGADRWLDDWGTGTYADPSLAWYRSALAHTAPIVDGGGQEPVAGELCGWHDEADSTVICGRYTEGRRGVRLRRAVALLNGLVVDVVDWVAPDARPARIDLPLSVGGILHTADGTPLLMEAADLASAWRTAASGATPDEGVQFASAVMRASCRPEEATRLELPAPAGRAGRIWCLATAPLAAWQMVTPGPPAWSAVASPSRSVRTVLACDASSGRLVCVWDLDGSCTGASLEGGLLVLHRGDGRVERHQVDEDSWTISEQPTAGALITTRIHLHTAERTEAAPARSRAQRPSDAKAVQLATASEVSDEAPALVYSVTLGEDAFLRADTAWAAYGQPSAALKLWADPSGLRLQLSLHKQPLVLADPASDNRLDTWPADLHGDTLLLAARDARGHLHEWSIVPRPDLVHPQVRSRTAAPPSIEATASIVPSGLRLDVRLPRAARIEALALVVCLRRPTSERRDGALVWPPRTGFVYGLGDRVGGSIPLVPIHLIHV